MSSYGTFLQETSVLEAALIGPNHTSDQHYAMDLFSLYRVM